MNSLLTRNLTPIPRSTSPLEGVASVSITTTVRPHTSVIRLHAHTEALEDSLSRSSRDKRSQPSPQASDASSSSPQKRGSSEVSSFGPSPLKVAGRRSQRRFNTLPLPVRADSKIETSEKEKSKDKDKDSIWAISGVKLEKFCKNLLKKPGKRHQKDSSRQDRNDKSNNSDKDSPGKTTLVRTSSEPRTTGKSRFYLEKVNYFREDEPPAEIETRENGKSKKKSDRFLKKKANSTSLLQRNVKEKLEAQTTEEPEPASVPIKIKIRESQSNSSEEAFSPVFLKNDQWSRLAHKPEHQGQEPRRSIVFRTPVTSAGRDGVLLNHTRHQKERPSSQSSSVKIRKLEREPCRRSRNVNPSIKSNGTDKDDYDDVDGVVRKRESILSDASRLKKVPEPSSSSSSSKRDKTSHKVGFSRINGYLPAEEERIRRKTEATGTGYVTSGESYVTTSPLSGEHSTLSDSGYSVTSNDPLFTDTGFLVLDSVGAASRISASSTTPRCSNGGVKNVNAGHIHAPSTKKENAVKADQATPRDIQSVLERTSLDSNQLKLPETKSQRAATTTEQFSTSGNYCNTFPQVKNTRKVSDSYLSNDQTASSTNLTPGEVSDSAITAERSRLTNRTLGFSRQDFETLKHRAKSVELILPKRSKQRGGKRRACSISRERRLVTVTTTTEEIRYPKPVHDGSDAGRGGGKSDNLSEQLGTSAISRNGHFSRISDVFDDKGDQLLSLSTETEHKGMQTSPDKRFMTTDFPFTSQEHQVVGQDRAISANGRHSASIQHLELSEDQYIKGNWRVGDDSSFSATSIPLQKHLIKDEIDKNIVDVDEQNAKSNSEVQPSSHSTGIKDTKRDEGKMIQEYRSEENRIEIKESDKKDTQGQPKKLPALSYFDGSRWLTSSDEAASEEDQKTRTITLHRYSETGKRCVETQTSEDICLYLVPPTLDQSSQTNLSSVSLESDQKNLKGSAEDRNAQRTSSSSSGQHNVSGSDDSTRRDQFNRRDSVKSIIAHEYGEMYSIFREIPPSLTFLKASLVSNEQFNASKDLKMALEKHPHLRTGSWSWGGRSVGGFGIMLAPSATQQHGKKIYDQVTAPEGSSGEVNELNTYRFEPILEQFKLLG